MSVLELGRQAGLQLGGGKENRGQSGDGSEGLGGGGEAGGI